MVDEVVDLRSCRLCGALIRQSEDTEQRNGDTCAQCAVSGSSYSGVESTRILRDTEAGPDQGSPPERPVGPDNPPWGPLTGLGTWAFSVAASIVIPLIPFLVVIVVKMLNGASLESIRAWAESSNALLLLIIATFPAEAVIFLFCWAVVTGRGKRPFLESLGWNWAGRSVMYWCLVSIGVVIVINVASNFLLRWLPERPSPFEEMLKSSPPVRIGTVLLAVLAAPLVEEIVYRGVLFSALRKRLNAIATVLAVTVIFVGVHIPQYLGAWRTVAGLTLLSLTLTILRAQTSSVLPSFLVHLLNNTLSSVAIMLDMD